MKSLLLIVTFATLAFADILKEPDEKLDFFGLIESRGFVLQTHKVTTKDGYILTLHRVVTKDYKRTAYEQERKPVILNHGLISSATIWFINTDHLHESDSKCGDNFGFCLVMTGKYDVWLTNNRGNGYSMEHVTLSSKDKAFWTFTFDQMAKYDTPAIVDYVRNETKHNTVGYVGHSQGNAVMFGFLSEQPEYANIIKPYIAWSPAVFVGHMKSMIKSLVPTINVAEKIAGEFILTDHLTSDFGEAACRISLMEDVCLKIVEEFAGPTDHMDKNRIQVYLHFWPSPSSTWQVVHYGQLVKTKKFQKFDYLDAEKNFEMYGQNKPPEYPLHKISSNATIAVFYGKTDYLVGEEDVHLLLDIIRPVVKNLIEYEVPAEKWNHMDFLTGKDAGRLMYDKTLELLDKYTEA